jgi:hypothetical protein
VVRALYPFLLCELTPASVTVNQDQSSTLPQNKIKIIAHILTSHLVEQQLNDGIRLLQMQAHLENGVIRLCHTSCVSV